MALITALVLCARPEDSLLSVSVRRILVVITTLLDLRAEEGRVLRYVQSRAVERHPESLAHSAGIKPKPLVHYLTALPFELSEHPHSNVAHLQSDLSRRISNLQCYIPWDSHSRGQACVSLLSL